MFAVCEATTIRSAWELLMLRSRLLRLLKILKGSDQAGRASSRGSLGDNNHVWRNATTGHDLSCDGA